MIQFENDKVAIKAIHDLLIKARYISYSSNDEKLISFLDKLEYLPALILEERDNTDLFTDCLTDICNYYGYLDILEKFEKNKNEKT